MSNKLKLWFDKNINDIKGCLPNGEKGRWDIYLLFNAFLGIKILDDNNLITELKNRGYDISTIKFEITKKNSEIQPVTTKDLTLDMWDKSIVNKIKRLEKSIELNNKVKKDLKKQLDQLKQQLAESFTEEDVEGLIEDRNKTIKFLQQQLAEKDIRIEELEGQFAYECECNKQLVELQKQLEEKDKEIAHLKEMDNYHLRYELAGADETITNLKQQLEEKDNYHLRYELAGADETITNLKKQIEEKDKEISRLKERLSVFDNFKDNYGYTNYDDSEILEDLQSRAFQAEDDTQVVNELLQFFNIFDENELVDKVKEPQTQLAIQELEKVKKTLTAYVRADHIIWDFNVNAVINQQIKELKGE